MINKNLQDNRHNIYWFVQVGYDTLCTRWPIIQNEKNLVLFEKKKYTCLNVNIFLVFKQIQVFYPQKSLNNQ